MIKINITEETNHFCHLRMAPFEQDDGEELVEEGCEHKHNEDLLMQG